MTAIVLVFGTTVRLEWHLSALHAVGEIEQYFIQCSINFTLHLMPRVLAKAHLHDGYHPSTAEAVT